jgi:hypothetical protein
MKTDDLIARLAAGLVPVARLPHPGVLALRWLGLALLLLGALVLASGLRHDAAARFLLPEERVNLLAALATGVAAAVAAFQLALPDRDARWAWLPVPPALFWLAGLGWGCLRDMAAGGWAGLGLGTSFECLRFILLSGVPLTAAMLWMARHAAPLRPEPVAALAGLAAAALSSVALSLIHHLDAAAMVLLWHGSAAALLVLASRRWGWRALRAAAPRG